jgi:hypothetical protein
MTLLEQIQNRKTLWMTIMPEGVPIPNDQTFFLWISYYPEDEVEYAIIKTGKRMGKNAYQGVALDGPDAAARYCSSILKNLAAHRKGVA